MTKTYCDRCRREIPQELDAHSATIKVQGWGKYRDESFDEQLDLCPECAKILKEFIQP